MGAARGTSRAGIFIAQEVSVLLRRLLSVAVVPVLALAVFVVASPASAASGGGCQLQGTASFSPGLTNTAGPFTYNFSGTLSSCQSSVAGSPATGTVSAGQAVAGAAGEMFQEPVPSGNGTCANGTTSGTAIITWADATTTVIQYSTNSAAAAVLLQGTVISSVTLSAINPLPGQPTSETITTTRYAGDNATGTLTFQADPTQCNGSPGVTSAGIGGATFLTGP